MESKVISELNMLENKQEGWHFIGKDKNSNFYKKLKKFHYFVNGQSLCGKYINEKNDFLPTTALFKNECCKICFQKLQELNRR